MPPCSYNVPEIQGIAQKGSRRVYKAFWSDYTGAGDKYRKLDMDRRSVAMGKELIYVAV